MTKTSSVLRTLARRAAPALLLAAAALLAYSNVFRNTFHFDDSHVIENNIYLRSLRNIPLFFADAHTFSSLPQNAVYRPLVSLTLAIDYWIAGGLHPWAFHLTQIVLLIGVGILLLIFFESITSSRFAAAFAAIWFCVHTVNSETMNLISARSELLAMLGLLGSFVMYIRWPASRERYLYLIPMLLGALAKTPALLFAPLLLIYLWLFERRVRPAVPAFLASGVMFWFISSMDAREWTPGGGSWLDYVRSQPWVWLHYIRLFFLPTGLNADTDLRPFPSWRDPRLIAGLLAIALLVWLIWRFSKVPEQRPAAFGLAWFVITLLPTSLIPLAEVANEHRVFMPYAGMCLAVSSLVAGSQFETRRKVLVLLAGFIIVTHMVGTWNRNRVWRTEETLWADVVRKSPENGRALMNYGLTQMSHGRLGVAKHLFERAQTFTPNYSFLEINLGIVNNAAGDTASAERHFQRALELSPDATSHYHYAQFLVRQGRAPEAIPHLVDAIRLSPAFPDSRRLLMQLYTAAGRQSELAALSQQTLKIDPSYTAPFTARDYRIAFKSGIDALRAGDFVLAAVAFRRATDLQPRSSDAWNNLGWTLGRLGFFDEAVPALEEATRLRPDFDLARNNLAWARTQQMIRPRRAITVSR